MRAGEYEREWTAERGMPACSRRRIGRTNDRGIPERFVVQLEYWHAGAWLQVARFDHDATTDAFHNVELTGLHLDLYTPDGDKFATLHQWPPQPANDAMGDAEDIYTGQRRTTGTEVQDMAVNAPSIDDFDRPDLRLSPLTHVTQAEVAAERGEEYDPYAFERRVEERRLDWDEAIEAAEPVEGKEDLFEEWRAAGTDE